MRRAQTTLPALAVALVVLTVVTGIALAVADGALASRDRTPEERRLAATTADSLVAPDGPLAVRGNVLSADRVGSFDRRNLTRTVPAASTTAIAVSLNGTELAATGEPAGGTTIRRLVLVERRENRTITPNLTGGRTATLPRRTTAARLTISPPPGTDVWTVRADNRVVLHNRSGLSGNFTVELVPYETTELRFQGAGRLPPGSVTVSYAPPRTTKATLAVTVDA